MGVVIGMDEAGYGPNLGPLVITATVWQVPEHPREADFWNAFAAIVDQRRPNGDGKIHVADSKEVYHAGKSINNLEESVFCLLSLCRCRPRTLMELWEQLTQAGPASQDCGPWFVDHDLSLPTTADLERIDSCVDRWKRCCVEQGIALKAVQSDIVLPSRFNQLTRKYRSKGLALSNLSIGLLARVCKFDGDQATLVLADKHGGRNRYDHLLEKIAEGAFIIRQMESRAISTYRIGSTEIRFQTRAEAHFPVAAASLVSKYVRESAMTVFNEYWCRQVTGLKPTKGYPQDAKRFRADISQAQRQLGISDEVLWRER